MADGTAQAIAASDLKFFEKLESSLGKELCISQFSSKVAVQFLKARICDNSDSTRFQRVIGYVLDILNGTSHRKFDQNVTHVGGQSGCPNIIRGLRANPVWDTSLFPWIKAFEAAGPAICAELIALRGFNSFQPYRSPLGTSARTSSDSSNRTNADHLGALATTRGDWNVCYLNLHGVDIGDNLAKCPITAAAIEAIPRQYHHAFFSALAPSTHVKKHYGSTNKKLRCHLPLRVPKDLEYKSEDGPPSSCWLRVGDKKIGIEEGVAVVFDDSFEHEAANDHIDGPRIVLVVDFWHPDFSDEEVKFLEYIGKAQMATLRSKIPTDACTHLAEESIEDENFLDVIHRARHAAHTVSDASVWGV